MDNKIAGVVVLYNPGNEVIGNVHSFIGQIMKLYVVDNSEVPVADVVHSLQGLNKVEYIAFGYNAGIARALNEGARRAIADGFDYLLTMDQDSTAMPDMINSIMACYRENSSLQIGVVSPFHMIGLDPLPDDRSCKEELTVWTSGNILALTVYQAVGPFCDELFIDFVDHEYCMRLREKGFAVMRSNSAVLKHGIGNNLLRRNLLGVKLIVSNHSAVRRYYITRNRLFVSNKYKKSFPEFYYDDRKKFIAEIVTILMYEKQKIKKFMMIGKGMLHYFLGIQGSIGSKGSCT
jgi:rhamnosyltransferase